MKPILNVFRKIERKLMKIRLRPIRVFLFHQVSDVFDPSTMKPGDWTQTDQFKSNIKALKKKYTFIPIGLAYEKICKDHIRLKNYAVLTSDDGWESLKNVLPWLDDEQIPVTLFLNPHYFDGLHYRDVPTEKYLLRSEIYGLVDKYGLVTIGSHGWEHVSACAQDLDAFRKSVIDSQTVLSGIKGYVPYYAYTYGDCSLSTHGVLRDQGLTPVLIDGGLNYHGGGLVHRELIDGAVL